MTETRIYLDTTGRHAGLTPQCRFCGEQFRAALSEPEAAQYLEALVVDTVRQLRAGVAVEDIAHATTDETMPDGLVHVDSWDGRRQVHGLIRLTDADSGAIVVEIETDGHEVEPLTIVHRLAQDEGSDYDRLYIHGAVIADPEVNGNAIPDESEDRVNEDGESPWAYMVDVVPSEDEQPYVAALRAVGVEVTGSTVAGVWLGWQDRPLPVTADTSGVEPADDDRDPITRL